MPTGVSLSPKCCRERNRARRVVVGSEMDPNNSVIRGAVGQSDSAVSVTEGSGKAAVHN